MESKKRLLLIPEKAQFRPGEDIVVQLQYRAGKRGDLSFRLELSDLDFVIYAADGVIVAAENGAGQQTIRIPFAAFGPNGSGAYGVFVTETGGNGVPLTAETAVDVAEHWREAPRYGFLSDFAPGDAEDSTDVDFLNRHHINVVQFYDWMYRHDRLLPDEEEFTDPMGRQLSLLVVRDKMQRLRARGIASMAYAAVYASLRDYAEIHPEQLLYRNDGEPYSLASYFFIMDISPGSDWTEHIVREFRKVIEMGFDGLHLDQYGFPKKAIVGAGEQRRVVSMKDLYPELINRTRKEVAEVSPTAGLIFNNVSNYPVHTTAKANQDAVYIEVWDPVTHLRELKQLIDRGRELSGKQVILAAYLPCFHPERAVRPEEAEIGATLTMATIFACGGYHLLLGEHENVLTEGYYPKYGVISPAFKQTLAHYYDFIVMYRNLLYDFRLEDISMTFTGGINTEMTFTKNGISFAPSGLPGAVWTITKEMPGFVILHLINLCGLDNDVWHQSKKQAPPPIVDIDVTAELLEDVDSVFWASPDGETIRAMPLEYQWVRKDAHSGLYLRFAVPQLQIWSMVCIRTKYGTPRAIPSMMG